MSKNHVKVITRHVWEDYIEKCENIRHTSGIKERYAQRKQTIERIFGTAKENYGLRYTHMIGKARMEMKAGLTFACMNLKKLAKMIQYREYKGGNCPMFSGGKSKYILFGGTQKKLVLGWIA